MATFFGNPLTYVPIGVVSLKTGHFLLGTEFDEKVDKSLINKFGSAGKDLFDNLLALVADRPADWEDLALFYNEVFFPYMIGGLIPGAITATVCYILSVPLIRAYQNRRRNLIKKKFEAIRKKAEAGADDGLNAD